MKTFWKNASIRLKIGLIMTLFFLFVGASVIFSAVYLDRLPHDFEDF